MLCIEFREEEITKLREERFHHPKLRVEGKMEALLMKSEGMSEGKIGSIVGVSPKTLRGYFTEYITGGIEGLKEINFYRQQSELMEDRVTIEELFRENPRTAIKRIKELTGIVCKKKGLKRLKTAQFRRRFAFRSSLVFVKSPSGRQRYNVLGAFNAVSHELFSVTNNAYINSNSIVALMTSLVMDNARYQRCALVMGD